jgi:hypothetical protein
MTKRKGGGPPNESRESKAERTDAMAKEIIETDAGQIRAKTERLRALRLANEASKAPEKTTASKA